MTGVVFFGAGSQEMRSPASSSRQMFQTRPVDALDSVSALPLPSLPLHTGVFSSLILLNSCWMSLARAEVEKLTLHFFPPLYTDQKLKKKTLSIKLWSHASSLLRHIRAQNKTDDWMEKRKNEVKVVLSSPCPVFYISFLTLCSNQTWSQWALQKT